MDSQQEISLKNNLEAIGLFGTLDEYLKLIKKSTSAKIVTRGDMIYIRGEKDEVDKINKIFSTLLTRLRVGEPYGKKEILRLLNSSRKKNSNYSPVITTHLGKKIIPCSVTQQRYITAIEKYDLVIAIGPAGTGKTYLAVAQAIKALRTQAVRRIVLTRPVVEAGESLGFLPGDLEEKINPYLRPLYDAFFEFLDIKNFQRLKEDKIIEIVPLAYMRGRTLNDAFIILDEAQNTTLDQLKMFLTRFGFGSKAVITGDITQIDLANKPSSGLVIIRDILKNISGIKFIYFSKKDVVRHKLVTRIIKAYEDYEQKNGLANIKKNH